MTRYAIGDIQGCHEPLVELLRKLRFKADRDQVYFTGDLVNRGPQSLRVLRLVKSLGANARTVLGNHDLHLLAHHFDPDRPMHRGDTLLARSSGRGDRESLIEWLIEQPLLIHDRAHNDLFVHAGLVPQWSVAIAARAAREAETALTSRSARLPGHHVWQPACSLGFRAQAKGALAVHDQRAYAPALLHGRRHHRPQAEGRARHGERPVAPLVRAPTAQERESAGDIWPLVDPGTVASPAPAGSDTGCVWGGKLTAVNLDDPEAPPIQRSCRACRTAGSD